MAKLKIVLGVIAVLLLLALVVWLPLHFENKRNIAANEARKQARTEEIKKNNPALYDDIIKAIDENRKKLADKPDAATWVELGANNQTLGDYMEAEKDYKQAIKITAQTIVAWNNLAAIYREEGRYKEARDAYLSLIKVNGAVVEPYLGLAEMYSNNQAGTFQDAVNILNQGITATQSQGLKDTLKRLQTDGKL